MSHHHHDHHHDHAPDCTAQNQQKIFWAMLIIGSFMFIEVAGGIISGSLALLADAGHMLSDFAALLLSFFAFKLSQKKADTARSYGYHRMQILAAFVNGLSLLVIAVWICWEAIWRLFEPVEILTSTMLIIAIIGLIVNVMAFWVLSRGDHENLNIKGAAMHVLGDLLGSVAAIVAALVIQFTGWLAVDPLLSVLVAIIVAKAGWSITQKSAHILLEGTPHNTSINEIKQEITANFDSVANVHHVHIWSLTNEKPILTMHVTYHQGHHSQQLLTELHAFVKTRFNIGHITIQMEDDSCTDGHCH